MTAGVSFPFDGNLIWHSKGEGDFSQNSFDLKAFSLDLRMNKNDHFRKTNTNVKVLRICFINILVMFAIFFLEGIGLNAINSR